VDESAKTHNESFPFSRLGNFVLFFPLGFEHMVTIIRILFYVGKIFESGAMWPILPLLGMYMQHYRKLFARVL